VTRSAFEPEQKAVVPDDPRERMLSWGTVRDLVEHVVVSRRFSQLLVLIGLLLSVGVFQYALNDQAQKARAAFEDLTQKSVERLQNRIDRYALVLAGASAHAGANTPIDQAPFRPYLDGLSPGGALPQDFSLAFIEGGEVIDWAAPQRLRAALLQSRNTRQTVLTSWVASGPAHKERKQHRMLRPVFARGEAQRGDFLGWAALTFTDDDILLSLPEQEDSLYRVRIFDSAAGDLDRLIFASSDPAISPGRHAQGHTLALYGRTWRVEFLSARAFDAAHASYVPHALIVMGLLFTLSGGALLKSFALRAHALHGVADLRTRELGAREEENRALLETSVSVVLVLDEEGQIIFANEAAGALFHCARGALLGQPFDGYVTMQTADEASSLGNAVGFLRDGTRMCLDVQANSWRTVQRKRHTTMLIRNVTEQNDGHMAIEALHRRYDVALTGAAIGIFEIDIASGDAEMSETWHKIMGTDTLTVPFNHETHFLKRVHPEDLPALLEADRQCILGETERSIARYRVRFEDRWRWMYSDAVPLGRGPDGRATRLIGTQSDITELKQAGAALEASEARFRMMLQEAPLGMAVMDERGTFIALNPALARLSGYDADTLQKEMRLADLLERRDYVQLSRDVRRLLRAGEERTYQNQFALCTSSGALLWGLFNLSWTFDQIRGENVYIAQIVDITDAKRIEQIKSEFVATVSHELRTPLTSIKGALSILEATVGETLPERTNRLLEIASINAHRLTLLVNDILDLEKISSGEVVFELENVNLFDLVAQTLEETEPVAVEHRNTLSLTPIGESIWVHADAGRIRQVICNLVSNACKYSDPDTAVTVEVGGLDDEATLWVINTGPPVPERFRAQLFEPFTQADGSDTRSKGGTGLGLNIVRQIMVRSGGDVGFEQLSDRRTAFWITVPIAIAEQSPTSSTLAELPMPAVQAARPQRVLHIEGDRDFAAVVAASFQGAAQLTHVTSVAAARRMLDTQAWDVVLTEIALSDGDMGDILHHLSLRHTSVHVISLSATQAAQHHRGIDLRLIKSQVDIDQIVQQVTQVAAPTDQPVRDAAS